GCADEVIGGSIKRTLTQGVHSTNFIEFRPVTLDRYDGIVITRNDKIVFRAGDMILYCCQPRVCQTIGIRQAVHSSDDRELIAHGFVDQPTSTLMPARANERITVKPARSSQLSAKAPFAISASSRDYPYTRRTSLPMTSC